jgi:hypothetical protein
VGGSSDGSCSQLLTVEELSVKSRLSVATIHRLKQQGKIPFYQPAGKRGRVLFPPDAIERTAQATSSSAAKASGNAGNPSHLSGPRPTWMNTTPNPFHEEPHHAT